MISPISRHKLHLRGARVLPARLQPTKPGYDFYFLLAVMTLIVFALEVLQCGQVLVVSLKVNSAFEFMKNFLIFLIKNK